MKKNHFTKKIAVQKLYQILNHSLRHLQEGSKSFPNLFSKSTSHNLKALFSLFPVLVILEYNRVLTPLSIFPFSTLFFQKFTVRKLNKISDRNLWHLKERSKSFPNLFSKSTSHNSKSLFWYFKQEKHTFLKTHFQL